MMAQDVEVASSFQPLLGLAANFLGSHESQVADPMIEAAVSAIKSMHGISTIPCQKGYSLSGTDKKFTMPEQITMTQLFT